MSKKSVRIKQTIGSNSMDFFRLVIDLQDSFLSLDQSAQGPNLINSFVLIKDFLGATDYIILTTTPNKVMEVYASDLNEDMLRDCVPSLLTVLAKVSLKAQLNSLLINGRNLSILPLQQDALVLGYLVLTNATHPDLASDDFVKVSEILGRVLSKALYQTKQLSHPPAADKSTSYAHITHQLKTPLVGLSNVLMLLKNTATSPDQSEYLEVASMSTNTMLTTIDRMLSAAKLESYRFGEHIVDFEVDSEMLSLIKMEYSRALSKKLKLTYESDLPIGVVIRTEGVLLQQVVMNLLNNALKYTDHGEVQLKVGVVSKSRNDMTLRFEVVDTGSGIDEKDIQNLTQPYFRVRNLLSEAVEGSGLGLSIVKDILQSFGTQMEIKSKVGTGSTFAFEIKSNLGPTIAPTYTPPNSFPISVIASSTEYIKEISDQLSRLGLPFTIIEQSNISQVPAGTTLLITNELSDDNMEKISKLNCHTIVYHQFLDPVIHRSHWPLITRLDTRLRWQQLLLKNDRVEEIEKPKIASTSTVIQPWKVLVVDDNPINLKTLQQLLVQSGLDVTIANDSLTGIRFANSYDYDFILLDIKMPDMSGPEVLNIIRLLHHPNARIPIFAATAYAFEDEKREFLKLGFDDVITKPVNISRLINLMIAYKSDSLATQSDGIMDHGTSDLTFDVNEFNYHYQGLDSLKREVLLLFIEQSESSLRRIQQAVLQNNLTKVADEAHYYKGSCSYLSAPRITSVCTKMIEQARHNDATQMTLLMSQLIHETTLFNYEIRDFMNQQMN